MNALLAFCVTTVQSFLSQEDTACQAYPRGVTGIPAHTGCRQANIINQTSTFIFSPPPTAWKRPCSLPSQGALISFSLKGKGAQVLKQYCTPTQVCIRTQTRTRLLSSLPSLLLSLLSIHFSTSPQSLTRTYIGQQPLAHQRNQKLLLRLQLPWSSKF